MALVFRVKLRAERSIVQGRATRNLAGTPKPRQACGLTCTVTPLSEIQHETLTREAEHKTQTWEWMLTGYLVMFHLNLHVTTTIKIRMFVNMESMLWTVMV